MVVKIVGKESKKYKLNKSDLTKLSKSFGLALSGIVLDLIASFIFKVDFGQFTPMVYAFTPVIVNSVRKIISGK